MLISVDCDELLEVLMNRVRFWSRRDEGNDYVAERLYESMYENYIDNFGEDETPFGSIPLTR